MEEMFLRGGKRIMSRVMSFFFFFFLFPLKRRKAGKLGIKRGNL